MEEDEQTQRYEANLGRKEQRRQTSQQPLEPKAEECAETTMAAERKPAPQERPFPQQAKRRKSHVSLLENQDHLPRIGSSQCHQAV
jgi:hypothetical protein